MSVTLSTPDELAKFQKDHNLWSSWVSHLLRGKFDSPYKGINVGDRYYIEPSVTTDVYDLYFEAVRSYLDDNISCLECLGIIDLDNRSEFIEDVWSLFDKYKYLFLTYSFESFEVPKNMLVNISTKILSADTSSLTGKEGSHYMHTLCAGGRSFEDFMLSLPDAKELIRKYGDV